MEKKQGPGEAMQQPRFIAITATMSRQDLQQIGGTEESQKMNTLKLDKSIKEQTQQSGESLEVQRGRASSEAGSQLQFYNNPANLNKQSSISAQSTNNLVVDSMNLLAIKESQLHYPHQRQSLLSAKQNNSNSNDLGQMQAIQLSKNALKPNFDLATVQDAGQVLIDMQNHYPGAQFDEQNSNQQLAEMLQDAYLIQTGQKSRYANYDTELLNATNQVQSQPASSNIHQYQQNGDATIQNYPIVSMPAGELQQFPMTVTDSNFIQNPSFDYNNGGQQQAMVYLADGQMMQLNANNDSFFTVLGQQQQQPTTTTEGQHLNKTVNIELMGSPRTMKLEMNKLQLNKRIQSGKKDAKSAARNRRALKQAVVLGQKTANLAFDMKKESVQFTVQPQANALVTPQHPMFQNQMEKLNFYKDQVKKQSKRAQSRREKSTAVNGERQKTRNLLSAQQPAAPSSRISIESNILLSNQQQQQQIQSQPMIQNSQNLSWVNSSMQNFDPYMNKKTAKTKQNSRFGSTFHVKRDSRKQMGSAASISSSINDSQNISSRQFAATSQPSLPFQYVNHGHRMKNRKKSLSTQVKNGLQMRISGQATGIENTIKFNQQRNQYLEHLKQAEKSAKQSMALNNNILVKKQQLADQHQTLQVHGVSTEKSLEMRAPSVPFSQKSSHRILKSSLEILLREGNENGGDQLMEIQKIIDSKVPPQFYGIQQLSIDSHEKQESSKDSKSFMKPQYQGQIPAQIPSAKSMINSESVSANDNYGNTFKQKKNNLDETFNPLDLSNSKVVTDKAQRDTEPTNYSYRQMKKFDSAQKQIETHRIQINESNLMNQDDSNWQHKQVEEILSDRNQIAQSYQEFINQQQMLQLKDAHQPQPEQNFNKNDENTMQVQSLVSEEMLQTKGQDDIDQSPQQRVEDQLVQQDDSVVAVQISNSHLMKVRPQSQQFYRKRGSAFNERLQKMLHRNQPAIRQKFASQITSARLHGDEHQSVFTGSQYQHGQKEFLYSYGPLNVISDGQNKTPVDMKQQTRSDLNQIEILEDSLNKFSRLPQGSKSLTGKCLSVLQDLQKKDMQFKQIFQGIPNNRSVSVQQGNSSFNLSHKGKFSFAKPSEIQYELRKKHVDACKRESIKVRSTQAFQSRAAKKNYQKIMHVPGKRIYKETKVQSLQMNGRARSSINGPVHIIRMGLNPTLKIQASRPQSTIHAAFPTECFTTEEAQNHFQQIKHKRVSSHDNNSYTLESYRQQGSHDSDRLKMRTKLQSANDFASIDQNKINNIGVQVTVGEREISSSIDHLSALQLNHALQSHPYPQSSQQQSNLLSNVQSTNNNNEIMTSSNNPDNTFNDKKIIYSPKRLVVDLDQFEQSLSIKQIVDENLEDSVSQLDRMGATQIDDHTNVAVSAKNSTIQQKQQQQSNQEAMLDKTQNQIQEKTEDIHNDTFGHKTPAQIQTLSHSQSIPQGNKIGSENVSLNNNKLWMKQFVHQTNSTVKLQPRPSDRPQSNHSHGLCQNFGDKNAPHGQILVGSFLNQSLRQINMNIPVKPLTAVNIRKKPKPTAVTEQSNFGGASVVDSRAVQQLQVQTMQIRDKRVINQQKLMNHKKDKLSTIQGKRSRSKRAAKATDSTTLNNICTTPVSLNPNLIRTNKTNNLSSYAHPVNIQDITEKVTEHVEL